MKLNIPTMTLLGQTFDSTEFDIPQDSSLTDLEFRVTLSDADLANPLLIINIYPWLYNFDLKIYERHDTGVESWKGDPDKFKAQGQHYAPRFNTSLQKFLGQRVKFSVSASVPCQLGADITLS